jgi:hypothetical protein
VRHRLADLGAVAFILLTIVIQFAIEIVTTDDSIHKENN